MTYLLLKYAHLLAFVYWLGGDLGTFLASRQVVNPKLGPESRQVALKIMLACDMGPKLAMPLILPLGLHLAHLGGALPIPAAALGAAWLLAGYWFAVVLTLHIREGTPFAQRLARLDFYFRIIVALGLLGWAGALLAANQGAGWAVSKVVIFALMVCCGLMIRVNLKPFVPAFAGMMTGGPSDEGNAVMARSIARCRPWVWCIWAGLFANAAIGIHLIG